MVCASTVLRVKLIAHVTTAGGACCSVACNLRVREIVKINKVINSLRKYINEQGGRAELSTVTSA
jgi:hypothetical protein